MQIFLAKSLMESRKPQRGNKRLAGGEGGIQTFFSDANKIKDLASHILVKIAQGHQKGHQKILKELTITNNELVKRVYRKRDESQFCQTSMMPFFTSSPVSLLKNALCELRQSLSRRSSAYVRDQCSSQWLIACELSNGLPYKALLCT